MAYPYDVNRDQNTGFSSDSSSPSNSEDELSSGSGNSTMTTAGNSGRSNPPPSLPISFDQFFANTDLQAEIDIPLLDIPLERPGDPVTGIRLSLLLWVHLILRNRDFYLRSGRGLRRSHAFYTRSLEELDSDSDVEIIGDPESPNPEIWPQGVSVRDRMDVIMYTMHGFLTSVGRHFAVNVPHAQVMREFNLVRVSRHQLGPEPERFMRSIPGRVGLWAANLLAQEPVYSLHRQQYVMNPVPTVSNEPFRGQEAPSETTNTGNRRSSEPVVGFETTHQSRPRFPSDPSISETMPSQPGGQKRVRDKGKKKVDDPGPDEPSRTQPNPSREEPVTPPAPPQEEPVPQPTAENPSASFSRDTPPHLPYPSNTEATRGVGDMSLTELMELASRYRRQYSSKAQGAEGFDISLPVVGENGEAFMWNMPRDWYYRHRRYVDAWVDRGKSIILGRQMEQVTNRFRQSYLLLEQQLTGNNRTRLDTHDPLMMAASRYGTRPTSQYTERGVQTDVFNLPTRTEPVNTGTQTTAIPRIGRHVQTDITSIDPRTGEPPIPLDVIIEEDEPEEVSFISEAPPQTPRQGRREYYQQMEKNLRDQRAKSVPINISDSDSSRENSPPRPGPSHSQHIPSSPFPGLSQSDQENELDLDFIPDDPESYHDMQARIIEYWLNVSRDPNADARMRRELKEHENRARAEQARRIRLERERSNPGLGSDVRRLVSEWKEIKKELEEGRDLRRRYEERHGKGNSNTCTGCSSHNYQGCNPKGKESNIRVSAMRDSPPHMQKPVSSQSPKHVSWASDVKDGDTTLPVYTAQPHTPAPAYTIRTDTAGDIDPGTYSDSEVFVQQAHEFDTPGSGSSSSRNPNPSTGPSVHFSTTPRVWSGRGRGYGRGGAFRISTPYPGRAQFSVPVTPRTSFTASSPGDPGDDEPSDDDEDPFRNEDQRNPRAGKQRDQDPDDDAINQATPSFIIDAEDLERQISQMVQNAVQNQSRDFGRGSPNRNEPLEDRLERESRKERREMQSKLRFKDPDPFSGEDREEFDPFIEQCEAIYEAKPDIYADANAMINHCASWTSGKAEAAIRILQRKRRQGHRVVQLESWGAFVAEMRKDFGLRDPEAYSQAKVMKAKQEPGESYGDFYNRFSKHAVRSGFDDSSLRWHLLHGLTKPTLSRLRGSNTIPRDYTQLHEHLRDLDTTDHTLLEAELIDSYDLELGMMPTSTKKTTTTTTTTTPKTVTQTQRTTTGPVRQYQPPNRANPRPYFNSRNNQNQRYTQTVSTEVKKAVTGLPNAANTEESSDNKAQALPWPSKEVRDQRRKDGLCLLCGSDKHYVPNCPHNQRIARGAVAFAEADNTDTVWVTDSEGMGHLVYYDDFIDEDESENEDETQENTNSET